LLLAIDSAGTRSSRPHGRDDPGLGRFPAFIQIKTRWRRAFPIANVVEAETFSSML
jgi:hypothetical protein